MVQLVLDEDFNLEEISEMIQSQIGQWRSHKITLNSIKWEIFDHDGKTLYSYIFNIDFEDIEARVKLEDLRLDVIHFVESLKDDTVYEYYL